MYFFYTLTLKWAFIFIYMSVFLQKFAFWVVTDLRDFKVAIEKKGFRKSINPMSYCTRPLFQMSRKSVLFVIKGESGWGVRSTICTHIIKSSENLCMQPTPQITQIYFFLRHVHVLRGPHGPRPYRDMFQSQFQEEHP